KSNTLLELLHKLAEALEKNLDEEKDDAQNSTRQIRKWVPKGRRLQPLTASDGCDCKYCQLIRLVQAGHDKINSSDDIAEIDTWLEEIENLLTRNMPSGSWKNAKRELIARAVLIHAGAILRGEDETNLALSGFRTNGHTLLLMAYDDGMIEIEPNNDPESSVMYSVKLKEPKKKEEKAEKKDCPLTH